MWMKLIFSFGHVVLWDSDATVQCLMNKCRMNSVESMLNEKCGKQGIDNVSNDHQLCVQL